MDKDFNIIELNKKYLSDAIKLQKRLFPLESGKADLTLGANGKTAENQSLLKYWLAQKGSEIIGIVGIYAYKDYPKDAWLGWFGVDEKYRKKGIGGALFDFAVQKAKELKFQSLRLYTDDQDNADAVLFYEKKGMISEKYTNEQDSWFQLGNTLIFSLSLDKKECKLWNNKYLALNIHENLNTKA